MINSRDIYSELTAIADNQLELIEKSLPNDDPAICLVLLIEVTRVHDFLHFGPEEQIKKYGLTFQERQVVSYGWNIAASLLFKSIKHFAGIPAMESTNETRTQAIGLLYQLGCTTLLRRTAEMVKSGILSVDEQDNIYSFSMSPEGKSQYLDAMEPSYLENLKKQISKEDKNFYKSWKLVDREKIEQVIRNFGAFISKESKEPFSEHVIENLDKKMLPLVKPWDSGKGIMIAYDSTEELDRHFMVVATRVVKEWRDEAGLHPNLKIGDITVSDICAVVICLVSFNLKHIKFTTLASEKFEEVSIPQSLTIWSSLTKLINDISDFTGINNKIISEAFEVISLNSQDSALLRKHTTSFMPLIINLENDFVLRSVSSIITNPLNVIKDLMVLRDPFWISKFSENRESWLRDYLYAMFMGTRYHRVSGNINLRIDKKDITDIDAAIYDNTTGELALFQIKWQDYHFNDVKKLRSRASNLTKELDKWTKKVTEWISSEGIDQLARNLRLPNGKRIATSKIYLFGLSKNAVRMKGYGFELKEQKIAITTWTQFIRNRTEIGPSENVFDDLFVALKEQENIEIEATPRPVTFKVLDKKFHYKDLWSTVED